MQYVQHQDQINKIHDVETTKKTLKALGNLKKKEKSTHSDCVGRPDKAENIGSNQIEIVTGLVK